MSDAHWDYILLAYGVAAATIAVLVLRIVADHRRLRAELARLGRSEVDEPERGDAPRGTPRGAP